MGRKKYSARGFIKKEIMIDRNFALVQKESNVKKESFCYTEP